MAWGSAVSTPSWVWQVEFGALQTQKEPIVWNRESTPASNHIFL